MTSLQLANIYQSIGNLQTGFNEVVLETMNSYNQLTQTLPQQVALNNSLYFGYGNLSYGNANVTGDLFTNFISTRTGQTPFRMEYGTTGTVNTTTTVTFDQPFTVIPTVQVNCLINSTNSPEAYITAISTTDVTFYARNQNSANYGNLQFTWVAFGY
jgi:hypothetical protein